ncbi:MAG: PEP-CTERM sorting domain-containing protein [Verrucomicrobiota bacterium]
MIFQGKHAACFQTAPRAATAFRYLLIACFAAEATAKAGLFEIQPLDYRYSTYTYSRLTDFAYNPASPDPAHITVVSNRNFSPAPISNSVISPTWNWAQHNYTGPDQLEATAGASLYRVEAFAESAGLDSQFGQSIAAAMTRITFVPQATGSGTFHFDLVGKRQYYGAQMLRLTDLTLGQEVWCYGDAGMGGGTDRFERLLPTGTTCQQTIPWEFTGMGNTYAAQLNLDTYLNASSTYELTLFATVESQAPETEHAIIEWTAAMAVPEPSAMALVGCGAVALLASRRNYRNQS